jgi:hypothetical protein
MSSVSSGGRGRRQLHIDVGAFRMSGGVARAAWRMFSALLGLATLALVAFHVWLFWGQWQVGLLTDPLVALRWGGSALLVAALIALHRRGVPLFRGRQALVVWTLAAVVHVGADSAAVPPSPEFSSTGLTFVVPSVAGIALIAGCALLAHTRRRRLAPRSVTFTLVRPAARRNRPARYRSAPRALRAPPLAV